MEPIHLRFDRGTLRIDGPAASALLGAVWDGRVGSFRAPAYRYATLLSAARARDLPVIDHVPPLPTLASSWTAPNLRPYQEDALRSFRAAGRRGLAALPTGSGKTVLAIAAMADAGVAALVLCPTRALLEQWAREIGRWYAGSVGVVGDGERRIAPVTVSTFESAYRMLDAIGDRFGMLVVDEAHHFAGGLRVEALEMCTAPFRLGLTATAPEASSDGGLRLADVIGPTICEISVTELVGTHLAELEIVRLGVRLAPDESEAYARSYAPFAALRAAFFAANPGADFVSCVRAIARTESGRRAISAYRRAVAIASFPSAKRTLLASLLTRHAGDKTLVFTACTDDAYAVGTEHLVPVITADTSRAERAEILERFRAGTYRTLASACVLNEGIDVPDARVAIVVGGRLGAREHIQRIGRVLRPAPGKRAVVYELVTHGTVDDSRARARRRTLAADEASIA